MCVFFWIYNSDTMAPRWLVLHQTCGWLEFVRDSDGASEKINGLWVVAVNFWRRYFSVIGYQDWVSFEAKRVIFKQVLLGYVGKQLIPYNNVSHITAYIRIPFGRSNTEDYVSIYRAILAFVMSRPWWISKLYKSPDASLRSFARYPLVNCSMTMENHHAINGETH